jgi:rhamnosyltransferase
LKERAHLRSTGYMRIACWPFISLDGGPFELEHMDVSIVIRTKNEGAFIGKTLAQIREQDFGGSYEIIIVDSGSTDSTLDQVRAHAAKVLHIPQADFSYGRSLNLGAGAAGGEFVVNLSAHALPVNNQWLGNLLRGFEAENVAAVYGRQISDPRINPFEALQNERFFGGRPALFKKDSAGAFQGIQFTNSNCCIRRAIWQMSNFDEDVRYAEDYLWQREVLDAGYSIAYSPSAAVYHAHRVDIRGVYRNAKHCSYVMAEAAGKRPNVWLIPYDLLVFPKLAGSALAQNAGYLIRNRCYGFLKIMPCFVMARLLGWLAGRAAYRLEG